MEDDGADEDEHGEDDDDSAEEKEDPERDEMASMVGFVAHAFVPVYKSIRKSKQNTLLLQQAKKYRQKLRQELAMRLEREKALKQVESEMKLQKALMVSIYLQMYVFITTCL